MIVGRVECVDIASAQLLRVLHIQAAPGEAFACSLHHKQIRHQSRMPAVAVSERVDLHEPVMKADGDLVGRVGLVLDPCGGVGEQLSQCRRDLVLRNPDVAFSGPEVAGPSPYVAKHAAVQVLREFLSQYVAAA